jgi:hypothetical protein
MFSHHVIEQYLQKKGIKRPTVQEADSENERLTELFKGVDLRTAGRMTLFELLILEAVFKLNKPKIEFEPPLGFAKNPLQRAAIFEHYFNVCFKNKPMPSAFYGTLCCDIASTMAAKNSISVSELKDLYQKSEPKQDFSRFISEVTDEKFTPVGPLFKKINDNTYQFADISMMNYFETLAVLEVGNLPEFLTAPQKQEVKQSNNRYSFAAGSPINSSYKSMSQVDLEENMEKYDLNKEAIVIFAKAIEEGDLKTIQNEFKELEPKQKQGLLEMMLDFDALSIRIKPNPLGAPYGTALQLADRYKHPDITDFLEKEQRALHKLKR